jgi:hypothetical protein
MSIRVFIAAASAILLFGGCDEGSQASVCKGLSEADCSAKTQCSWNAEKAKCKKTAERMVPEQSEPDASEAAPPEQDTAPSDEGEPPLESPEGPSQL